LWITRLSRHTGVERLAGRLGHPDKAAYLYVALLVVIDGGVLSTARAVLNDQPHPVVTNPLWLAVPVGLVFAVWSIRSLTRAYDDVASRYDADQFAAAMADPIYDVRRTHVTHLVFLLLVAVHVVQFVVLGNWVGIAERVGPVVGGLSFGLLIPLGYFPVLAEFGGIVLATVVFVPRSFVTNEFQVAFDDPLDAGGLEPVGDLLKQAAYVYAGGLVVAILFEYGGLQFDTLPAGPVALKTAEFLLAWGLGVVLVGYGVVTLHLYMQRQRRAKIEAIDARLRALGGDDRGIPETDPDEAEYRDLELEYLRLQKVKDTSTMPFSAAAEERLVASALAPIVLEVGIDVVL
jgi:hypothetical protein